MARRITMASVFVWALTSASAVLAEAYTVPVSISAGPLPVSLQTLERQTGIELLFDHAVINGLAAPAIRGDLTGEAALRQLLADTDLTVRRAQSGAWIVEPPVAPPLAQPDAPVPEILVLGQRTQNADIRRFEDDVQPYTVATKAEILRSHRNDVDQFFNSRITSNTQVLPPGLSQNGSTLSQIDLRGLGAQDTLVLVDGRRMPSIPDTYTGFIQADINAIPLHAIERIEVLTGAAGGIHGFGALGGVVNVVLDRDSRGVDLYVTEGITSRGDGQRHSVEARFGHLSQDGATDFMVFAAHSQEDTVLTGDRDFAARDRRKTFQVAPQYYGFPGNSIRVQSFIRLNPDTGQYELNPTLVLKPEYGGATLSANRTYLPAGFAGDGRALAAALTEHAGQEDFSVPTREAQTDLGSNPRSESLLANVRHRFGAGFEVYADAMILRSRGESQGEAIHENMPDGSGLLGPESPVNPFIDYVDISFPVDGLQHRVRKWTWNSRYTGGVAAELPLGWRGNAEISAGGYRYEATSFGEFAPAASLLLLLGDPSDLETNPFGNWEAFQQALMRDLWSHTLHIDVRSRFRNQSLRFAGPVFNTAAGPATLTLLAEHRSERVPGFTQLEIDKEDGMTTTEVTPMQSRSTATTSFYAELRTRVFDETAPTRLLRGLELQWAIRQDNEKDRFARDPTRPDPEWIHARFESTAYTFGAKVSPTPWLMFRGSYATGDQPPPLDYLLEFDPLVTNVALATDPKRGNSDLGADGEYTLRLGGDATLTTRRATTASLGMVLTPSGQDGPRLAVDYSRIRRTHDLYSLPTEDILAHEDAWPSRVTRASLTDEDRANGYTAGRVTMVDTRISNGASMEVDALDVHASWPFRVFGGRLRLYAEATSQLRNVQQAPFQTNVHVAGQWQGPLRWRANGGFDWSTERLTVGANMQYFGSYLVRTQGLLEGRNEIYTEIQGSRSIPSQSYLDLHATWRPAVLNSGSAAGVTVDFGIVNALDKSPPRESSFLNMGPGYSRYGDPRQRRFELGLSCHF